MKIIHTFVLEVKNVPLADYADVSDKERKKLNFEDKNFDDKDFLFSRWLSVKIKAHLVSETSI